MSRATIAALRERRATYYRHRRVSEGLEAVRDRELVSGVDFGNEAHELEQLELERHFEWSQGLHLPLGGPLPPTTRRGDR